MSKRGGSGARPIAGPPHRLDSRAMAGNFIDRLIDWKDFERFVAGIYAEDENLLVEHNVTLIGKSGATRQIDVRFTHTVKAHTYVTVVECKRWKDRVTRERIDVLAATIEDVNASKGVMFTTTGFEPGAEAYAKQKGIDLFLVRDLTDKEWGLPGRVVSFYLHIYGAQVTSFQQTAQLIATVPNPPASIELPLIFRPDGQLDETMTLRSITDGGRGPNLLRVIAEARQAAMQGLSPNIGVLEEGNDASRSFLVPIDIDLCSSPYQDLHRPYGVVRMERMAVELIVTVNQSLFEYDRGSSFDLAVAVENYVTQQRSVVTRSTDSSPLVVVELGEPPSEGTHEDLVENGMLFRVFTEPYVTLGTVPQHPQRAGPLTVRVNTQQ
jgi:hypothetical protein